jgi:hypothetical protein
VHNDEYPKRCGAGIIQPHRHDPYGRPEGPNGLGDFGLSTTHSRDWVPELQFQFSDSVPKCHGCAVPPIDGKPNQATVAVESRAEGSGHFGIRAFERLAYRVGELMCKRTCAPVDVLGIDGPLVSILIPGRRTSGQTDHAGDEDSDTERLGCP